MFAKIERTSNTSINFNKLSRTARSFKGWNPLAVALLLDTPSDVTLEPGGVPLGTPIAQRFPKRGLASPKAIPAGRGLGYASQSNSKHKIFSGAFTLLVY